MGRFPGINAGGIPPNTPQPRRVLETLEKIHGPWKIDNRIQRTMLSAMTVLLFLLVAAAVVALIAKAANAGPQKGHEPFPVTIIRGGKTVTFDGHDSERLEKEIESATAQAKATSTEMRDRLADKERMTVAITGTLSEPRAQIAIKINSTRNARFVEGVSLDTDYLVAARMDTTKARAAAQNGTIILTEQQLTNFLSTGEFPYHRRRDTHSGLNFDESEIKWEDTYDPCVRYRLAYADSSGEYSERIIEVIHLAGEHPNGYKYLAAFDDGHIKTFRKDRILKLERLG